MISIISGPLEGFEARPPGIAASLRCTPRYPNPPAMCSARQSPASRTRSTAPPRDRAQARELTLGPLLADLAPGQRQEHVVQCRAANADPTQRRAIGGQQLDDEGVPFLDQKRQAAVDGRAGDAVF